MEIHLIVCILYYYHGLMFGWLDTIYDKVLIKLKDHKIIGSIIGKFIIYSNRIVHSLSGLTIFGDLEIKSNYTASLKCLVSWGLTKFQCPKHLLNVTLMRKHIRFRCFHENTKKKILCIKTKRGNGDFRPSLEFWNFSILMWNRNKTGAPILKSLFENGNVIWVKLKYFCFL